MITKGGWMCVRGGVVTKQKMIEMDLYRQTIKHQKVCVYCKNKEKGSFYIYVINTHTCEPHIIAAQR